MRILGVLFLFFVQGVIGQSLHHQMVSVQGGSVTTNSGHTVNYSVGQQSVTGTTTNQYIVQQGFEQNNWSRIIKKNKETIRTSLYPNPFVDQLTFDFSSSPGTTIQVLVFDILGRIVHTEAVENQNNQIKLNLSRLSSAEYLIKLTSNTYEFATTIIKQ